MCHGPRAETRVVQAPQLIAGPELALGPHATALSRAARVLVRREAEDTEHALELAPRSGQLRAAASVRNDILLGLRAFVERRGALDSAEA
jgi:hypothetical protein